jgi:TPR repeat protein
MRKINISFGLFLMVLSLAVPVFAGLKEGADAVRRRDYQTAYMEFSKAAEQGNAVAQYSLGLMYVKGTGVAKNEAEAVKWFRKAAEQGYAAAQLDLGISYEGGRGVAKDEAAAVKWYRKAAEQGVAIAQHNLGFLYMKGRGVAKDEAEAVKWYRKAAEQGFAEAQYNLGLAYARGMGGVRDDVGAVKWFRKAAAQGFVKAQQALETMYPKNRGTAGLAQNTAAPRIITEQYGSSRNYRVEGSLASTRIIGCIPLSKVQNTFTPPDLYRGLVDCISQDNYDFAVRLSALAGIYACFDAERVADKSAGQAKTVLVMNTFAGIPQEKKAKYVQRLTQATKDPERLGKICHEIREIGMPDYYPSYMILHGIKAFEGNPHNGALLKDFDSQKVWTNLLTTFLHCPM